MRIELPQCGWPEARGLALVIVARTPDRWECL